MTIVAGSSGSDEGRRPGKEAVSDCVGDDTVKPLILRKVQKPVFKVVESVFDEESLLIKQELNDEDDVCDSKIVGGNNTVKRPVTVDSLHSQTAHPENVVNKAATESFKGTVKRKPKTITFVTSIKIVEANDVVKGS